MRVKKEHLSKLVNLGFEDDEIDFNGYWRSLEDDNKISSDDDLEVEETYSYQGLHVLKKRRYYLY